MGIGTIQKLTNSFLAKGKNKKKIKNYSIFASLL